MLCVKGSGSDMAAIEPAGLPAVRLDRLRKLRARAALTDEDMVRVQRENLLEPAAPNPSVETLLHAFLPHKFVDHTHANAILSLVDQPDGEAICAEVYDGRMSVVPYVMPGFALAKTAADVYDARPGVEGLILHKHGIFTFGASAREAYERMIALVTLAEERLKQNRKAVFVTAQLPQAIAPLAAVAPILRGACSLKDEKIEGAWRRLILDFRSRPGHSQFRQRRGARALQPGRRGDARPHHPHQELAARRRRARARQDGRFQARRAGGGEGLHRALPGLFRAPQCARRRDQAGARSRCRASRSSPASACSASDASKKDARIAADLAALRGRDHHRCRGDRPLRIDFGSRHVRHGILVARTGQARRGGGEAARRADRRHHRRRRHDRGGDRQGVRRGGRRGGAARPRRARRRGRGEDDRRRGAAR